MATLYAGSKNSNLLKSLNDFVRTKLETNRSLVLDWGQPGFKEEGRESWVQFRFQGSTGRYRRHVDNSGRVGELKDGFLVFNLFERTPPRQNIYALSVLWDAVVSDLYKKDIPIYDYDSAGNPLVERFRVMEISNDSEVEDGKATGLRQHNITFRGRFLFRVTL